jgi:MFS family permease
MGSLRRRQTLVSLKYSTIEASFSIPMLQLTLGNTAFVIGFAVKVLGWKAAGVGFLAATPFLTNVLQLPISLLLQRRMSLHAIARVMFLLNAVPWFLVTLFPLLSPGTRGGLFAGIVVTSAMANSIGGVAWSSSMSELVPLAIRGRYFGRRNLITGAWTLLAILATGAIVDRQGDSLAVFAAIFAVAAVFRLIGMYFFTRMTFPPVTMERRPEAVTLRGFAVPLKDLNFLAVMTFNGIFGMFLFAGVPFYNVFALERLGFGLGDLAVLTTIASLAGLVSAPTWGPLNDRFGGKNMMIGCVSIWTLAGTAVWLMVGPAHRWLVFVAFALHGFMLALCQLLQFNMMLKLPPAEHRTQYISAFYAVTNAFTAVGPLLGGILLTRLPDQWGRLFGQPLTRYHFLIVGSLVLCFASLGILRRVREQSEGSLRDLLRHVGTSPEHNPLLMLLSAAQGLLDGRALELLIHGSRRTLRRQSNILTEVLHELGQELWRVLRTPITASKKSAQPAPALQRQPPRAPPW